MLPDSKLTFTKFDFQYRTEWKVALNGRPFGMVSYEKPRPGETTYFLCTCLHLPPHDVYHGKTLSQATKWMENKAELM